MSDTGVVPEGTHDYDTLIAQHQPEPYPDIRDENTAVIAVAHPQWLERPLAVVVPKAGCTPDPEELRAYLGAHFAKWWVPDGVVLAESLPRTATGKVRKLDLRAQHQDYYAAYSVRAAEV